MNNIGLAEVSSTFIYWRECVRRLHICPWSKECQLMSAKAQAMLVMTQAYFWAQRREP